MVTSKNWLAEDAVLNEEFSILDKLTKDSFPIGTIVRVKSGGDWGKVVGYDEALTRLDRLKVRTQSYVKVKHYFGFTKEYSAQELEHWQDPVKPANILQNFFEKFFCAAGVHSFEQEPARKDLVKGTGCNFGFWSTGIQKAVSVCIRHGCTAEQKVYREGLCGISGSAGSWSSLSKAKEQDIDSRSIL